jgi:DNA-binding winged helix-turn-helix (wHTH) protein/tetratricopeptide (TPR) repeat protein
MFAVQWYFDTFHLDAAEARLWRGEEHLALPPKPFAVLQYLVTHPGRLVTKAELLDAVWPETAITDAVLRIAIGAVRKVLGDTAQTPRYIATVPRHGYRFLRPVTVIPASASRAPGVLRRGGALPLLIAREAVLQYLHQALDAVQQGTRQVVVLTGEAGLGKTAVVETFLAQAAAHPPLWVAHGQCVEHFGAGEAYRPILEALGDLCRGSERTRLTALLLQQAPTWAAQMPWLLTAAHRAQLRDELQGATRERMLREGAEMLTTLTAERPLVLVLEDLHWSDYATVDLLALLARRRTPAQLLVLGTFRLSETMLSHPLRTLMADGQQQGTVTEIPLAELSPTAVATYLATRFPHQHFPVAFAAWLHQRTDGNPLFLVTLVQALMEQGILHAHEGCWTVQADLVMRAGTIPASLRQLLEQHIARLAPPLQRVVEVASVAGVEFAAAAVSAGLGAPVEEVEEQCEALVARQFLRPLGVMTWPDGTVAARYAFRHALYQQAVYARLGAGQRVRLHQRLGTRLEAAYGAQAAEVAAELAEHFVRGAHGQRAVYYLHQAAENAAQRCAHREVVELLTRALTFLRALPETPARTQQELAIQLTLGTALIATKGYAALEVAQTYARAHVLCHQVPESPQLAQTLMGLGLVHTMQGAHLTAQEIGRHLLALAARLNDQVALLQAHGTCGMTAVYLGDLAAGRVHLEQGLDRADALTSHLPGLHLLFDFGVVCRIAVAWVLQQQGYIEQACARATEALVRTQQIASPYNRCNLLLFLAIFHLFRGEWHLAQHRVEEALRLATALGFLLMSAFGTIVRGAARTAQDHAQEGRADICQGLTACHTLGTKQLQPWGLAMLAESEARLGQPEAGLTALAKAHALMTATGDAFYAAEIARLQGELCRQASEQVPDIESRLSLVATAETCFQHALDVGRRQQAKFWELRAAMSLSRLWQQQGKHAEARALLAPVYGWFTEGFDTADLQKARVLLEELAC